MTIEYTLGISDADAHLIDVQLSVSSPNPEGSGAAAAQLDSRQLYDSRFFEEYRHHSGSIRWR